MSRVDFKEIPNPRRSDSEPDNFEFFAREFLEALKFRILEGPGRGADRGKDLIVSEILTGIVSSDEKKWVVSAKHYAHSGRSVPNEKEIDPIGRVKKFNADGFMGFYSTIPSSGLNDTFSRIKSEVSVYCFDKSKIEYNLVANEDLKFVFKQYFPNSYKEWIASTTLDETSKNIQFTAFSKLTNEELRNLALELISQIRKLIMQLKQKSDDLNYLKSQKMIDAASEVEKGHIWQEYSHLDRIASTDFISDYQRRYKVQAILLRDEMKRRLPDSIGKIRDEYFYEDAINRIAIEKIADNLENLARSLL